MEQIKVMVMGGGGGGVFHFVKKYIFFTLKDLIVLNSAVDEKSSVVWDVTFCGLVDMD